MTSALERKLIVMTGKGGVGKTTLTAALGLLAARRGRRTIVVELSGTGSDTGAAGRLATLLGHPRAPEHGVETPLADGLWGLSIDRDRVLAEWLRALGGRVPARVLTSSASFQYLIAAAPGAREMINMVKLWELAHDRRPAARARGRGGAGEENGYGRLSPSYDLVVLDAPATGHALALLRSPQLFAAIARVGPIARQARQVRELLEDPSLSAYVGVTQATEMATTETLELREGLRRDLGRDLHAILVNGSLPRRFAKHELGRIAALQAAEPAATGPRRRARGSAPARIDDGRREHHRELLVHAAARTAHAVHERARAQQGQIARLRRSGLAVHTVPFDFRAELDLDAVRRIADRLDREL